MEGELKNIIEALLFSSDNPLKIEEMAKLTECSADLVTKAVDELTDEYAKKGVNLFKLAGGYRFLTSPAYYSVISKMKDNERKLTLSRAAMETLAIVAYRQNITSQEIAALRGVQSVSNIVRNLQELELIVIAGRKEVLGRPLLYKTTEKFLELFGINTLDDLPTLEEIGVEE